MKNLKDYSKWVVAFIFAVAVITVYKTYDNFSHITGVIKNILSAFKPFFVAFIIAYVLNLPAVRIERAINNLKFKNCGFLKKHSHGISIATVYIVAIGLLIWVISSLVPKMYVSLMGFMTEIPSYLEALMAKLNELEAFDGTALENSAQSLMTALEKAIGKIDVSQFGKYAMEVVNITSGVFDTVIAIIASVYMLLDKEIIKNAAKSFFGHFMNSDKKRELIRHSSQVNTIFTNYIYSRLVCCAVMAVVCTLALTLIGVKYALILGLFIGAMDMIPYFGSIISSVVAILVAFVTGGPIKGITALIILLILQQIDGNILGPKIMGETLEIRPLLIIIAVTVGGSLFGFMGMLLSVPIAAVLRIAFSELMNMYEESKLKNDEE